jgi:AcrR family transcriptional regulator
MARPYTLKRRAELQAATRQRIVEAAIELHGSVGPASTTVSMVAERAGVQRHTFYAHFPAERDLLLACSGLALERDPLPDADGLLDIPDRLNTGILALYDWYQRNAALTGCVLRDAEHHALTREINDLRTAGPIAAYRATLGKGLNGAQRALLGLALSYYTWRTLTQDNQLKQDAAVTMMVQAIAALK